MDIPRYLLIAASALLAVMLLGEWTAFKAEYTRAGESERRVTASPSVQLDAPLFEGETSERETPVANLATPEVDAEEVPVVSLPSTDTVDEAGGTDSARSLISVTTDTLEVVVDLKGGDIIEVALPAFPDKIDRPDVPFVLLEENTTRTYVAQSGLVGPDGIDSPERAIYTATQSSFSLDDNDSLVVTLTAQGTGDATVTKTYSFTRGSYVIELGFEVENRTGARWQAVPFAQLKRDSSPPPDADTSGFGMQPFLGAATTSVEDRFEKFSFDDIADDQWKANTTGGWIAMLQHYFLSAWIPNETQTHQYSTRQTRTGFNIAGFTSPALSIDPGNTGSYSAQLYVGPKDQYQLAELSPYLDLTVDYGWLWWIAKPLFWLLTLIQEYVHNWGVAIILLTVLVKAAFFKLSAASYRSMAKMRKVQPKMLSIREQYPDDKQKQSQEMMELYKKEQINPMGGCLPILIQMPVFIALYWVLMESVELRQAPFALWIDDLSVMDPYFVLPLIMGASMYFMQKLNPPPPDPMQAKIMQYLPVVFTFFFLWFPSGLVLYWVCNNLLSMAQQWVITRNIEREGLKS